MNRPGRPLTALLALLALGCSPAEKEGTVSPPSTPASSSTASSSTAKPSAPVPPGDVSLPSGLKYRDLVVGDGTLAEYGKQVAVHYTGWLTDGTKFDSSLDRGTPLTFNLGNDSIIEGWHQGVKGMRVGGKRKLTIPPDLAYGPGGMPPVIPANSTLIFDIELLAVR